MSKRILLWGGMILGIVLLIVLLAKLGTVPPATGGPLAATVSDSDHSKGSANAKVTLVEYSDFQCPACGQMYPTIKQLAETFKDDLKMVYRHYPLKQTHQNAELAARASEVAALQGKFWEMHDMIFNTQQQWSTEGEPETFFVNLATSLGLDIEKFKADMKSDAVRDRVNVDAASGLASGIQGTPTFFVNGERIPNPGTIAEFENVIKAALNK